MAAFQVAGFETDILVTKLEDQNGAPRYRVETPKSILTIGLRQRSWPKQIPGYRRIGRLEERDSPMGRTRVYVSDTTNETLAENLVNRRSRPYNIWKKNVMPFVLLFLNGYFRCQFEKVMWSQRCGCGMCPCSPGFILEGRDAQRGFDVWVDVEVK